VNPACYIRGMGRSRILRLLLAAAVLAVLLAPICDSLDRRDRIHGSDGELTVLVFACAASSAFWAARLADARRERRARGAAGMRQPLAEGRTHSATRPQLLNIATHVLANSPPIGLSARPILV
jgi:hypothetical protein